jgi:hypothetical protein
VGAYIISKRKHVTHRLQIGVKPDAFNSTLGAGDLVRVRLDRIASTGAVSVHDYLYEVDRIGKSITGEVQLDLTHFPVDAARASVVAQEVNAATGSGLLLPTGLSGITCDVNSSTDTSVPAETFTEGTFPDYGSSITDFGGGGFDFGDVSDPTEDNPEDVLDNQADPSPFINYPKPGDPQYPPSAPAGLTPILQPDGTPAPGPVPSTWQPGTWVTKQYIDAGTITVYTRNSPSEPCYVAYVDNQPASPGFSTIAGPCWGLYEVKTPGDCPGTDGIIEYWTAVISTSLSYWQSLGSVSASSGAIWTNRIRLENIFTPL